MSSIDKNIRNTQTALKDVNRLLKLDPSNTQLLAQKQFLLQSAIKDTKTRLTELKEADKQAKAQLEAGTLGQEKYDALQREIVETEQKLKELSKTTGSGSAKLAEISEKTGAFGNKATEAGKALMPLSTGTALAGVAAGKMAIDFETAFVGVQKTISATPKQLDEIKQGILDLAKTTSSSATDIAAVAEAAGQLGIKTDDIMSFTKVMVQLGDTTNISAEEAAVSLAKFANVTGMSADKYDNLGSIIVGLGNKFATSEKDIVEMGTRLASAGTIAGLTETDIMALATAMSSVGIEAEAGGTAMSQTLAEMEKAVASGGESLNKFAEISGMSSEQFKQSWESDPMVAIQAFVQGLGGLKEKGENATLVLDDMGLSGIRQSNMLKALALSSENMGDAVKLSGQAWKENTALTNEAELRYKSTAAQLSQMKETLREVAISFGELLLPYIKKAVEWFKGLTEKINGMSDGSKKAVLIVGTIIAALGPMLITIGKVATGISAITKVFSKLSTISSVCGGIKTAASALFTFLAANPVVLIIGAVIAAIVILWTKCEWFRDAVKAVWDAITNAFHGAWDGIITFFTDTIPNAWNSVVEFFQGIPTWWQGIWQQVSDFFSSIWTAIANNPIVSAIVDTITNLWQNAVTTIQGIWSGLCNIASGVWEMLKNIILGPILLLIDLVTGNFEKLKTDAQNIWNNIKDAANQIWTGIKDVVSSVTDGIKNAILIAWEGIKNYISSALNAIQSIISAVWNGIKAFVSSTVENIKNTAVNAFNTLVNGIKSAVSGITTAVQNGFQGAISFITSLPGKALGWGLDFINGMKNGIMRGVSGIVNAVKGVANKIRSFLHFSRPDEGPLRDYETWMPDFIDGMVKGISKNKYKMANEMKRLTDSMTISPTMNQLVAVGGSHVQLQNTTLVNIGNKHFENFITQTATSGIQNGQLRKMKAKGV